MKREGWKVLVTGAGRGIGRAFVDEFLEAGAERVYAGVRRPEDGQALAALDSRIKPILLDVTDEAQVARAALEAPEIDVLVNNAGVLLHSPLLTAPNLDAARREMETNVFGALAMSRAFAPALIASKGAVVNILSVLSLANYPLMGSYSVSKAAGHSMAQGLRAEFAPHGVRLVAAYPSGYDTDMGSAANRGDFYPPRMLTAQIVESLRSGGPDDIFPDPKSQATFERSRDDLPGLLALYSKLAGLSPEPA